MKTATKKVKSEAKLLDDATDRLLKEVKRRMVKKDGEVDYDKLREEGYSERFLTRLESL